MQRYGFYFQTRSRDVIVSCPCCKDYTTYLNPERNRDELIALMKASNDAFHLSCHAYAVADPFSSDTSTVSDIMLTKPANGIINSTNISSYPSINARNVFLRIPYGEPVVMTCRKCEGESLCYNYNPDSKYPSPFYVGSTVTEDYKRIHFNVKGFIYTFFKNKIQTHYYMTRIVFNKYTGRVTILRPLGKDNKPLKLFPEFAKMWNVTFGKFDARGDLRFINDKNLILNDIKTNLIPALLNALRERFPYIKDDHFNDCFEAHKKPESERKKRVIVAGEPKIEFGYVFRNIIRKFRFHDLPTEFLDTIGNYSYRNRTKILSRVGYLSKQQHSDLIKIAGRKLPKSLRKSVLKDFNALLFVRNVKFIKSVSNMNKMIERFANDHFEAKEFEPFFYEYMRALMEKNAPNFKNEDKLYEHCETICVNRFTDDVSSYWIQDTYNQLMQIREQGETYEINTDLSMRQLHDDVSSALRKIRTKNKELTYTDKEKEIEWNYDKYAFKLAHDTHYLVDVGANMNICVGGYGDRAHSKVLHIVTVSSPDNPYECCIEMTADMKSVRQAKTKHNNRPKDELLEAVMAWVEEKKLKIDTHDLPREDVQEEERLVFGQARPAARRLRIERANDEEEVMDLFDLPAVAE